MAYFRLTLSERKIIEMSLRNQLSIHKIALALNRSTSTVAREIKRHRIQRKPDFHSPRTTHMNDCSHLISCVQHHLCADCNGPSNRCKLCQRCNLVCPDFLPIHCNRRNRSPGVCTGCHKISSCRMLKFHYKAMEAQKLADKTASVSRAGFALSDSEIAFFNQQLAPLIKRGQSIHAAYLLFKDQLSCCEKSLRRYLRANCFNASVFDLPRTVQRRPYRKKPEHKVDQDCHCARTFQDYKAWQTQNGGIEAVEMDTVVGPLDSKKVLLTFAWPNTGFLLAFLLENKSALSVSQQFDKLRKQLGKRIFSKLFPVILTDRGSEFSDPAKIEFEGDERWTSVFYCDPRQSQQKPHVENEHTMLRRIFPKGTNFDDLEQKDIDLALSHISSYPRPSKGDRTPQELFEFLYGYDPSLFGLERIPQMDITLKPALITKNRIAEHSLADSTCSYRNKENLQPVASLALNLSNFC